MGWWMKHKVDATAEEGVSWQDLHLLIDDVSHCDTRIRPIAAAEVEMTHVPAIPALADVNLPEPGRRLGTVLIPPPIAEP
jgi:hypothetical protein